MPGTSTVEREGSNAHLGESLLAEICDFTDNIPEHDKLLSLNQCVCNGTLNIPCRIYRSLNGAVLRISTSGTRSQTASAALLYTSVLNKAPRAFDALVFDGVFRKMTLLSSIQIPGESVAETKNSRKRKRPLPSQQLSCSTVRDNICVDDSVCVTPEDVKSTLGAFWKAILALTEKSALSQSQETFVATIANGFAGLLNASMPDDLYAIVEKTAKGLVLGQKSSNVSKVAKDILTALFPVVTKPGLGALSRATILKIVQFIAMKEQSVSQNRDIQPHMLSPPTKQFEGSHVPGTSAAACIESSNQRETHSSIRHEKPSPQGPQNQLKPERKSLTLAFIHACCLRVPERVDDRSALMAFIVKLLQVLDCCIVEEFLNFCARLSNHARSLLRLFAVEVMLGILCDPRVSPADQRQMCIGIFMERTCDKVPAVRAKALSCLCVMVQKFDHSKQHPEMLEQLLASIFHKSADLQRRANDDKSGVRKAVLQLVGGLATAILETASSDCHREFPESNRNSVESPTQENVNVLHAKRDEQIQHVLSLLAYTAPRCNDVSAAIRRLAVQTQTNILETALKVNLEKTSENFANLVDRLCETWLLSVLPRIADAENTVQDAALCCIAKFLNDAPQKLSKGPGCDSCGHDSENRLLTILLRAMRDDQNAIATYMSRAIGVLMQREQLHRSLVDWLLEKAHVTNDRSSSATSTAADRDGNDKRISEGAWALLATIVDADCRHKCLDGLDFEEIFNAALVGNGRRYACQITVTAIARIASDTKERIRTKIQGIVSDICSHTSRNFEPEMVTGLVRIYAAVLPDNGNLLISLCEKQLGSCAEQYDEAFFITLLVTIGEACIHFVLRSEPSAKLINQAQALISREYSERLRATAITTMGKLCLVEIGVASSPTGTSKKSENARMRPSRTQFGEYLARRSVSLFLRELQDGDFVASRVNALIVLSDLCRKYTSVVEPHIDRLAMCLRDKSQAVRKRALASLTSLLQEDYLKVRGGPLYFRLLLCLLDEHQDVCKSVQYVLSSVLLPKSPMLFSTNFIESIYVANNYEGHNVFNRYVRSTEERQEIRQITSKPEARFRIYNWLISRIPLEQRIAIPSRIRQEILVPVLEKKMDLTHTGINEIVHDALRLLASAELSLRSSAGCEEDGDGTGSKGRDVANGNRSLTAENEGTLEPQNEGMPLRTKAMLLAKVYSVELREETVPLLLDLRHVFEQSHSPLLEELGASLCSLLTPFQHELHKFVAEPTIRAEIEFDIKAKQKRKGEKPQNDAAGQNAEVSQTPHLVPSTALSTPRKSPSFHTRNTVYSPAPRSGRRLAETIEASPKLLSISKRSEGYNLFDGATSHTPKLTIRRESPHVAKKLKI